jgi:hypothetical protein
MMTINMMLIGEKLSHSNHVLWKAQVLAVLRGAQLTGLLDGTNKAPTTKIIIKSLKGSDEDTQEVPNPAFDLWKDQEEQVLSYLLTFVSRDVLVRIAALPLAVKVWKHIENSFASKSCARVINTRMALATTQKGSSTIAEYIAKMKSLADDMVSARKKLHDEELNSYILADLDFEYNGVVSSIVVRVEPISFGELYARLLAFENRLDLQNSGQQQLQTSQPSINNASRGRGGPFRG